MVMNLFADYTKGMNIITWSGVNPLSTPNDTMSKASGATIAGFIYL